MPYTVIELKKMQVSIWTTADSKQGQKAPRFKELFMHVEKRIEIERALMP